MQKICVIGLGYIGLPTAAIFARAGVSVVGVDVNKQVVERLNKGEIIIEEVGLPEVVKEVVESGKLRASMEPEEADAFIISVPTPIHEDCTANVEYVRSATKAIVPYLKKGNVVIVESTIPPRTMDDVVAPIIEEAGLNPKEDVALAHCPERVLPGRILIELVENTRIVGGLTPEATAKAADVYRQIVTGDVIETEAVTAEMSKLMENTFRDVNIALANELAKISARLGVDAHKVIELANKHPRVNIHQPGPGVGGHCLAVDPYFIVEKAPEEARLIQLSRDINNSMPDFVIEQIIKLTAELKEPKIALFGLTYKGNIDDVRESPAIEIVEKVLANPRYDVRVHDPHVREEQVPFPLLSFEEAVKGANLVVVLADHNEFKAIDQQALLAQMETPVVFDTKNCTNLKQEEGLTVYRIGDVIGLQAIAVKPINS
ncbi:nucleotide sugar dehydrogenase [Bacillus badius]|uniref:UDP-glucose dehydrogenase n=1 Tax=Bacillus badius TaxID=1455 RepID=A0ABR5AV48_BACBA|nr:nucleotide sugar dehydrogenase [Bacillus badius]KIL78626.1 UDP-glucose dehydrogenase [Bacillus badius]KZN99977.1 UDP-N-acetyl-D-mannosamine dehydrogenase [Bacillus badius]MED4718643.1 nucleotide sugar dehydrogenase [Bacillus badius]OCS86142.1 UDP-N-acetyl-D-mannosamine dehydrogenase [Bacillus badius]OVE52397.1 UDP-N-acetyl-D-mannosamine dehydrogenase [Bacillus badius]